MLIGNAGFPDVAAYGFHSQAGWISFFVRGLHRVSKDQFGARINGHGRRGLSLSLSLKDVRSVLPYSLVHFLPGDGSSVAGQGSRNRSGFGNGGTYHVGGWLGRVA